MLALLRSSEPGQPQLIHKMMNGLTGLSGLKRHFPQLPDLRTYRELARSGKCYQNAVQGRVKVVAARRRDGSGVARTADFAFRGFSVEGPRTARPALRASCGRVADCLSLSARRNGFSNLTSFCAKAAVFAPFGL